MSEQSFNQTQEDEICLNDIFNFLLESWQVILISGVIGFFSAVVFIFLTPIQYEATAQIRVAQIDAGDNTSPLGINLEDPKTLIIRFKSPTTFSEEEVKVCKLEREKFATEALVNSVIKLSAIKGSVSLVELKILASSKEDALACAQAIFKKIKDSQNLIMKAYIDEAEIILREYQVLHKHSMNPLAAADKSELAKSSYYFSGLNELKTFSDEVSRLNKIIRAADHRQAMLLSPIYAPDNPVARNKVASLILGLLAGLFLGLLCIFARNVWRNYRVMSSN